MFCKNCGKTLVAGAVYCTYCNAYGGAGSEISVSMDVLEVDELQDMLSKPDSEKEPFVPDAEVKAALKKKKAIIVSLVSVVSAAVVAILGVNFMDNSSYGSLVKKADALYASGDHEAAYDVYKKAIEKNENGSEALIGAAIILNETGEADKIVESENYIRRVLDMEPENEKAFDVLMESYTIAGDTEALVIAEQYAVTDTMKETYNRAVIEPPVFSEISGTYDDDLFITLTNKNNYDMYYTLNGADPTNGSGTLYEGPITIKGGTTNLRTACFFDGKFGLIKEETYVVEYKAPAYPDVSPMSGTFDEQTFITITTDAANGRIYYTWDGTDPTTASERYTGPIPVIPGNNVLSIIVVDKHDMVSEVLRCNYTYLTDEMNEEQEQEEVTEINTPSDITDEGEEAGPAVIESEEAGADVVIYSDSIDGPPQGYQRDDN